MLGGTLMQLADSLHNTYYRSEDDGKDVFPIMEEVDLGSTLLMFVRGPRHEMKVLPAPSYCSEIGSCCPRQFKPTWTKLVCDAMQIVGQE